MTTAEEEWPPTTLSKTEIAALRDAARSWSEISPVQLAPAEGVSADLDLVESRGSQPGFRYVRVLRSAKQSFERVRPGWLQATPRTLVPPTRAGRVSRKLRNFLLGNPLATSQMVHERLTKAKALAVLSSDALSSVAYATEQIYVPFGFGVSALAMGYDLWIMGAVLLLLTAVVMSYRQTIKAYPQGGGSYIVAKDNLGPTAGLVAASALIVNYVLTVAVSIASGWDSVVALVPAAESARVWGCLAIVLVIALGNLRGIRDAGTIFAIPTYLFLIAMFSMLGSLTVQLISGGIHPAAAQHAAQSVSIVLILRSFAAGCTAITGTEAISDGVLAFKAPEWRNARRTLTIMGGLLGTMFLGITVMAHVAGLSAQNPQNPAYKTVIAQLAGIAFGNHSWLYAYILIATTLILVLAANTAFSDFPRVLYFLSRDHYAPHQFSRLGDRLAFSNGIIVLTVLSATLLLVFGGRVDLLIPLYAVGVFLAYTMSQTGMVRRWLRLREPGWQRGLPVNIFGAILTAIVFIVTGVAKFTQGAFIVVIVVPILVMIFRAIHHHYSDIQSQLATEIATSPNKLHPFCIVPIPDLDSVALQSLAMARTVSDTVIAVHVCDDPKHIATMRAKWDLWGNHVPLEIIESPYRNLLRPLLAYIDAIDRQRPDDTLVIVLPELVATSWWHQVLHNQSALRIKAALLFRPGTVVINIPYHLRRQSRSLSRHRRKESEDMI